MILEKGNFEVNVVEKVEGDNTVKVANLTADKEVVKAAYIASLPEGVTIEDIKAISKATKQFLTDVTESTSVVVEDLMENNADINKAFVNVSGHGVHGSSIDMAFGRSKHYPDMTGKGGEGVTKSTMSVVVKDPGYMLTGNSKKSIVDRMTAKLVK